MGRRRGVEVKIGVGLGKHLDGDGKGGEGWLYKFV